MKELKSILEKKDFLKTKLMKLREIVENKSDAIHNSKEYLNKIDRFVKSVDGPIKVVFLGSFSAGKTTAIAGLLEEEKGDMQINTDESSSTIKTYYVKGFEDQCVFIDTPGLFGNKEDDNGGKKIRYEDITLRYISEADIIVYVVEAENPLKESHRESLNYVMRTLKKLPNTIFVINKMDSVASLSDDDDFKDKSLVKTENLINKLKLFVNLDENEIEQVNVVCVALNPDPRKKKKTLNEWFVNEEIKALYLSRSRIQDFREKIIKILENNKYEDSVGETIISVVSDICDQIQNEVNPALQEVSNDLEYCKKEKDGTENELRLFESKQADFDKWTNCRKNEVLSLIEGADCETISLYNKDFFSELGETWKENWNGLFGNVSNIDALALPEFAMEKRDVAESQNDSVFDGIKVVGDLAQKGASLIKEEKIDNKKVLETRNKIRYYTGMDYKFKPYGAKKTADKINQVGHALEGVSKVADFTCRNKEHIEKVARSIANLGQGIYAQYDLKKQRNELKADVVKLFDDFNPNTIEIESYKEELKGKKRRLEQDVIQLEYEKKNLDEIVYQVKNILND